MNVNLDENLNEGMRDNSTDAFFALLRAGLWEKDVQLLPYGKIDFTAIYKLAEEQSVVGLVAAGLEHVVDTKVPKEEALTFVGSALQLEQRNIEMNSFIAALIEKMRKVGIYTILVKGQGIAQCYENPLWRACGDVDLLFGYHDYQTARDYLASIADNVERQREYDKHLATSFETWEVELHGTLRSNLWKRLDRTIDDVQSDIFQCGYVRSWNNGKTQVFLPRADEDVIIVFAHILQHYFKEGIGLRQICDWCRLLWNYKDTLDVRLLERRLKNAGIMSEWNAFSILAVEWLGMPKESMPFYFFTKMRNRKAKRIVASILKSGNFGHKRDWSYFNKYPFFVRKSISFGRHTSDCIRQFSVFPIDSLKVWNRVVFKGLGFALKGE